MSLTELIAAAARGEIAYKGDDNVCHEIAAIMRETSDTLTVIGDTIHTGGLVSLMIPKLFTVKDLPFSEWKKWPERYVGKYEAVQVNHMVNSDPRILIKYDADDCGYGYDLFFCSHEKHYICGEVRDILIFNQADDGSEEFIIVNDNIDCFTPIEVAKLEPINIEIL